MNERTVSLDQLRVKIQPRAVRGVFARWRWAMVWLTQLVFLGLPWLNWDGRPAVLFDIEGRRFLLFAAVLHLQDFIYLTGFLVIAAMSIFLVTAVAGRLWCGYACPQTVYTKIFMWIEHVVEGDRPSRIKLDRAPMSARKLGLRGGKHLIWGLVALFIGVSFVGYFSGIRPLIGHLAAFDAGPWEVFWVGAYALITYGNAGLMREQVCKVVCPYARIQSALIDDDTLVITYDVQRGDPRGARSKKVDPRTAGLGDCVDCSACVQVCPTGIDIRNGLQNECIGCAACIDACDGVMDRVGYARGLIRYDTASGVRNLRSRADLFRHLARPRVLAYTALLVALVAALSIHLSMRPTLKLDVARDRGVLGREVEDGLVENVYSLQVENLGSVPHRLQVSVDGLPGAFIASEDRVAAPAQDVVRIVVRVRDTHDAARAGANPITLRVEALDDRALVAREKSTFYMPR